MSQQYNNFGRDQFNIDNVNVNAPASGKELYNKGLQLLRRKDYQNAYSLLKKVITADPSIVESYFYKSLALLKGKRPKKLDEWTVRKIEDGLSASIQLNAKKPASCALLAIVKYGYYDMNGFAETDPPSSELYKDCLSIENEDVREILSHITDPKNKYWVLLNSKM